MHNIWIIAEQFEGNILDVSYELLTRARGLAKQKESVITAVLFGHDVTRDALNALIAHGADNVLFMNAPEFECFLPEPFTATLENLIDDYSPDIILAAATSMGRTLMPYVAVKCHAGLTADCTELTIDEESGKLLQTRPAIGGNIMATIKTPNHLPQMATIRPKSTEMGRPDSNRTGDIKTITPESHLLKSRVSRTKFMPSEDELNLQDAERVVVVGRGIKKAENLPMIYEFAHAIGAAVGATRDVVDRGWLSYPHQIGLSGKTITPKLYIGLGVSGAIQHLAGMQTAETIIVVNKDPEAPIFKMANLGIVGDLFDVLPELLQVLKEGESHE